uniref:Rhodanese-like domain-containing protein chloroplastic-like n=1 Tax=Tetraselmis sp. GSL018 TaxID=582737 RepID=A0A061SE15_9CHLO|eukprot:CAMPEP_0177591898 /NCGR_PEP_ID=MMETSP0419_2-20121207/8258_1 /TAXON_ID=582737 /ORGANISM="Tetraselmis sp., Strain GSL018" /LENGTH=251 /DNA_ID=CAMNT_0019082701 /DNA_START=61 /DNA_END=816 /DNA_ORIENTATION=-
MSLVQSQLSARSSFRIASEKRVSLSRNSFRALEKRLATSHPKLQSKRLHSALATQAQNSNGGVVKDPTWPEQWTALNKAGTKSIDAAEAMRKVTAGEAVLIDVRKPEDYKQCHAQDAINVPLFKTLDFRNTDFKGMIKFAVYAVNGVSAVEPNPEFVDQIVAATDGKEAILYCEAGGMLEPTPNFLYGKESRSLRGVFKVLQDGRVKSAAHLSGGLYQWYQDGFEITGTYDKSNLGRTPNAAPVASYEKKN